MSRAGGIDVEEWRQIAGWPAHEVSSQGRVRRGPRVLALKITNGRPEVRLRMNGVEKDVAVRLLVARQFLGPAPTPIHRARHLDGDRHNSAARNLVWDARRSEIVCAACGDRRLRFKSTAAKNGRQYCSIKCRLSDLGGTANPNWRGGTISLRCAHCGAQMAMLPGSMKRNRGQYCSLKCKAEAGRKQRFRKPCEGCGAELLATKADIAAGRRKYCSIACKDAHRRLPRSRKEAAAASQRRRRILKATGVIGHGAHTESQWSELKRRAKYRCLKCKKKRPLTRDHIIPISKGGGDAITNIQPLCNICNSIKGARRENLL